jgi:hypothetical protein
MFSSLANQLFVTHLVGGPFSFACIRETSDLIGSEAVAWRGMVVLWLFCDRDGVSVSYIDTVGEDYYDYQIGLFLATRRGHTQGSGKLENLEIFDRAKADLVVFRETLNQYGSDILSGRRDWRCDYPWSGTRLSAETKAKIIKAIGRE